MLYRFTTKSREVDPISEDADEGSLPQFDSEELRRQALEIRCPKCRMGVGMACLSAFGRFLPNLRDTRPGLHAERFAEATDRLAFSKRLEETARPENLESPQT